jgi:carboxypeptidase C (cathepsin A)
MDNPYTPLPSTDLVLVDAVGTGWSRAADLKTAKKFWGVKGDAEAFGEFIRMYISRYERWSSPLYLLGESYGTTRSAEVSGYLADRGIQFNGIMLLSTILDFGTVEITRTNDLGAVLTLPTYTMVAAYHKKLPPELMQDMAKTRQEVENWSWSVYAPALAKGDALTPEERQNIIAGLAKYTGLKPEIIDWANLRVDVRVFTHFLLADQKLRVGRLDGRFQGPDPDGFMDTQGYDPSSAMITAPITSVFNDYVRRELGYKVDMPYYTSAGQLSTSANSFSFFRQWDWGSSVQGFPDTAISLREAMTKNPHLKVLVLEGYYDLATPYAAANYSFNHLDLPPDYRKNISYATYDSGHMVYLRESAHDKLQKDVEGFIAQTEPK